MTLYHSTGKEDLLNYCIWYKMFKLHLLEVEPNRAWVITDTKLNLHITMLFHAIYKMHIQLHLHS